MRSVLGALAAIALLGGPSPGAAADQAAAVPVVPQTYADLVEQEEQEDQDVAAARQAILELRRSDAGLGRFFARSAAYAVFATVRSGGAGAAGAHGVGVLFEEGEAVAMCQLSRPDPGLAPGLKAYSEVLFFETGTALAGFRKAGFTLDGSVSPVNAAGRGAARASYAQGMSVFTLSWVGSPAGDGVGGQRFACRPLLPRLAAAR
jgi:hypothetical protein